MISLNSPLYDLLSMSVILRIQRIKNREDIKENWEYYRHWLENFQKRCLEEPSFTEAMIFKTKPGQSAEAFNALAEAIAILSFAPGGVEFLGLRFESSRV